MGQKFILSSNLCFASNIKSSTTIICANTRDASLFSVIRLLHSNCLDTEMLVILSHLWFKATCAYLGLRILDIHL